MSKVRHWARSQEWGRGVALGVMLGVGLTELLLCLFRLLGLALSWRVVLAAITAGGVW